MLKPMGEDIPALFDRAGCTGQLCVLSLDGTQQVMVDADRPAVPASVIKILVALEAETQFAAGQLDPRERVTLRATERTPGPVLFSLFQDDVRASLRDLVVAMLTISDNVATDALLDRMGLDAVNARAAHLGLAGTVVTANLRTIINSIGRDAGSQTGTRCGSGPRNRFPAPMSRPSSAGSPPRPRWTRRAPPGPRPGTWPRCCG